jgi:Bacteriophage replication gene A protein (GPA)
MIERTPYIESEYQDGFLYSMNRWATRQTEQMPGAIAAEVLRQRQALVGQMGPDSSSPFSIANRFLMEQHRKLLAGRIWSAYDEGLIRDCAESWARAASVIPQLTAREEFARFHGIGPPSRKHLTDRYEECAARLADPLWWRRQIRKAWTRASENAVRELGIVRKGKMPYASDDAVAFRAQMKRNARGFQENAVLVNELGEQLGLFDVAQTSISNPALRRGEFMTRVRGFEELAQFRRDTALFSAGRRR